MITDWKLKHITTFSINKTLIDVSKKNDVAILELLRSTFQFLYILNNFHSENLYEVCKKIINEYEVTEIIKLSDKSVNIKTHLTKNQREAYESLPRQERTLILNQLISVVINNSNYSNIVYKDLKRVTRNPIINQFTINFFLNERPIVNLYIILKQPLLDTKIYFIESIIGKLRHTLENKNIGKNFYKNLYMQLFSDQSYADFCFQDLEAEFLLEQFKKIYFCMLVKYNIEISTKSNHSIARKTKRENKIFLKKLYEGEIIEYIKNEILIDDSLNDYDQKISFETFLREMHPDARIQESINISMLLTKK